MQDALPFLEQITPLILTLNEAPNIGRVLDRLKWAKRVVIVDSHSDDETESIVRKYPNAALMQRRFDNHTNQWNFGLRETGIDTDWVLALDADYVITEEFLREVKALAPGSGVAGFRARFRYCIEGKPLRATVYPPVIVLYRRTCAEYVQDGHTQRVQLTGEASDLSSPIFHDDRKSLQHWLNAQSRYMRIEADHLAKLRFSEISMQDRVRKLIVIAPVAMFIYCMFVKRNVLDGRAGLFYALQRSVAEWILSLYLLQALLTRNRSSK